MLEPFDVWQRTLQQNFKIIYLYWLTGTYPERRATTFWASHFLLYPPTIEPLTYRWSQLSRQQAAMDLILGVWHDPLSWACVVNDSFLIGKWLGYLIKMGRIVMWDGLENWPKIHTRGHPIHGVGMIIEEKKVNSIISNFLIQANQILGYQIESGLHL